MDLKIVNRREFGPMTLADFWYSDPVSVCVLLYGIILIQILICLISALKTYDSSQISIYTLLINQIFVWITKKLFRKVEFSCKVQLPRSKDNHPVICSNGLGVYRINIFTYCTKVVLQSIVLQYRSSFLHHETCIQRDLCIWTLLLYLLTAAHGGSQLPPLSLLHSQTAPHWWCSQVLDKIFLA